MQVAVEFRHRDWLHGEQLERTLGFLEQNKLAFVAVDAPRGFETSMPPITTATARVASFVFTDAMQIPGKGEPRLRLSGVTTGTQTKS